MKKILSVILCILLVLPSFAIVSNAETKTTVTDIGAGKGRLDSIPINKTVNMNNIDTYLDITQIAPGILSYSDVEGVILPEHLDYLPTQAFLGCDKLTSVTVPTTVTMIDDYAFADCSSLKTVRISELVSEIGDDIFDGCSDDLTVDCYSNSAIQRYCENHDIDYELLDEGCAHAKKAITILSNATCVSNGLYVDRCKNCDAIITKGKILATGHKCSSWSISNGTRTGKCSNCNAVYRGFVQKPLRLPFGDVSADAWYKNSVDFCYTNSLINGTSTTTFEPDTATSRAMLVRILASYCGADLTKYTHSKFADVPDGNWFTAPICWAYENNIVSGYNEKTFGTNDMVTREQMVCILKNFAQYLKFDTTMTADISAYKDSSAVSGWANDAVRYAVAAKLISGTDATHISPKGYAQRSQIAEIVKNFASTYEKRTYERVVVIALDGAGNYIKDAKTTRIDAIFNSYTAKTEAQTGCMSSFNSILTGSPSYNDIITNFGVEYLNSQRNYGSTSVFKDLENSFSDIETASFCANANINDCILEDSTSAYKKNSDGDDNALCTELCKKNGYLEKNDPSLLFVQFVQIERAAEHFTGGYGGNDYLTQIELTDAYVGKIYDKYAELGRADSTLFLLVTDSAGAKGTKTHYTTANDVYFGVDKNSANTEFKGELKITDTAGIILDALGAIQPDLIKSIPDIID